MSRVNDDAEIALYVVYTNPSDFPDKVVVRKQVVRASEHGVGVVPDIFPTAVCNTLEAARQYLPEGVINMGRGDADDPVITEVWI